jgi:hypothetical protein
VERGERGLKGKGGLKRGALNLSIKSFKILPSTASKDREKGRKKAVKLL